MYSSFSTYFFRSYAVSARWVLLNFRRIFASSFSTRARSCSCVRVRDARDPRRQSARLSLALSPLDASPRVVSFDRMPSPVVVIPRARALAAPYYCSSARLARTPSGRAYHRETAPCRRARARRVASSSADRPDESTEIRHKFATPRRARPRARSNARCERAHVSLCASDGVRVARASADRAREARNVEEDAAVESREAAVAASRRRRSRAR